MTTVRRVDAPVGHTWTDADSGPKHDPACACKKPSAEDGTSTIDAAEERAHAERERRRKDGPPVGSVTRAGIVK